MQECYVFDLDGTLANCDHRLHLIGVKPEVVIKNVDESSLIAKARQTGKDISVGELVKEMFAPEKDWESFYMACGKDSPNYSVINVARALRAMGYLIAILTGRDEMCRRLTLDWLERYSIKYDFLYMRAPKDYRQDWILKRQWLMSLRRRNINVIGAFEDRTANVDMFRHHDIRVFQVEDGNF